MKQLIVLIATVILGISLSGTVLGMGGNVKDIAGATTSEIETAFSYTSEGGIKVDDVINNATTPKTE